MKNALESSGTTGHLTSLPRLTEEDDVGVILILPWLGF